MAISSKVVTHIVFACSGKLVIEINIVKAV